MWCWGHSPALDLQTEIQRREKDEIDENKTIEILLAGGADARHVVQTLASSYTHPDRKILYHVIEPTMEQVARSILLLNICLDKNLGLQEATRYYLEIFGNTLLRPATAKYLARTADYLIDVVTNTIDCPWLDLGKLKHRDRDNLEWIFKFWKRATCEGVPILDYWDRRVRKLLQTRYDYRDGAFDWDFHMILKERGHTNLTIQEYRLWRNNGVAFTWLEGEPARSNPTLISNVIQQGSGVVHYAYLGDVTSGPFFAWGIDESGNDDKKLRATDLAERQVIRAIHEIRTREPLCDELIAAHRDSSILNCTIITEIPDSAIEQESWTIDDKTRTDKEKVSWTSLSNAKIIFHPATSLQSLKNKAEYVKNFDLVWVSQNMTKQIFNLAPLLKEASIMLVESRKYLVDLRKEDLQKFTTDLNEIASENGLRDLRSFSAEKHSVARFCKNCSNVNRTSLDA